MAKRQHNPDDLVPELASALVIDFSIYPRQSIDGQHISALAEVLRAGGTLPTIVAERGTLRTVDGVHRLRAHQGVHGPDAKVWVQLRAYASTADLLRDAVRLNAGHGKRLSSFDVARILVLGEAVGLTVETMAQDLQLTTDKLSALQMRKTVLDPNGGPRPIRRSLTHLAGSQLTAQQEPAIAIMGGQSPLYYVNQVIAMLEYDVWPKDHATLQTRLIYLAAILQRHGFVSTAEAMAR